MSCAACTNPDSLHVDVQVVYVREVHCETESGLRKWLLRNYPTGYLHVRSDKGSGIMGGGGHLRVWLYPMDCLTAALLSDAVVERLHAAFPI